MDNICFGKEPDSLFSNLFRGRLLNTSALIMRGELTGLASAWGGVTFETQQLLQPSLFPGPAGLASAPSQGARHVRQSSPEQIVGLTSFPSPGNIMAKCGHEGFEHILGLE